MPIQILIVCDYTIVGKIKISVVNSEQSVCVFFCVLLKSFDDILNVNGSEKIFMSTKYFLKNMFSF